MRALSLLGICVSLILTAVSCQSPPPPDPNELKHAEESPDALLKPLRWMSDRLFEKTAKREITEERARELIRDYARGIVVRVDPEKVSAEDAWQYGDMFRTAGQWKEAEGLLSIAVAYARETGNGDRRVNDSLRLAQALAAQGKVKGAITTVRSTFDAPDAGAAPILPAVLLEIVPAGKGKGQDVELAKLLEEAIGHHRRTVVDPKSEAGKAFLQVRWHHISNAWRTIRGLYIGAHRRDLWEAADIRRAKMMAEREPSSPRGR